MSINTKYKKKVKKIEFICALYSELNPKSK